MVDIPQIKWPERPEQIPAEVWNFLPAFPFEYSTFPCAILPLPRMILDKLCPLMAPPGANIKLSGLVITPSEVQIGYPVNISCTAKNFGTESGEKTVVCKVDGTIMAEQTVILAPDESTMVSFSVVPTVAKTYSVAVNGLTGSFKATTEVPPGVADIKLSNLVIFPTSVLVGQPVGISITASNQGTASGSRTIICSVNGSQSQQTVTLNPGESQVVSFAATPAEAKVYQVSVNGLTGSFVATAAPPSVYTCPIDGATFGTFRELWQHIISAHPEVSFIYGTITNIVTGLPIAGALVTLDSLSQTTDGNGTVLFFDLPNGVYTARVTKDGYYPWEGEREINEPGDTESINVRLVLMPVPGVADVVFLGSDLPKTVTQERPLVYDEPSDNWYPAPITVTVRLTSQGGTRYRASPGIHYNISLLTSKISGIYAYTRSVPIEGMGLSVVDVPLYFGYMAGIWRDKPPPVGDYIVQLKADGLENDEDRQIIRRWNIIPWTEIGVLTVIP